MITVVASGEDTSFPATGGSSGVAASLSATGGDSGTDSASDKIQVECAMYVLNGLKS